MLNVESKQPEIQVWRWGEQHYLVIWGTCGVFAADGPLPLEEARSIRDSVEQPRLWDEDLGDELDFAAGRGEIEIIDAAPC